MVGAGPNGLVAALVLARAGLAVDVYEAADVPGGGCRTAELTLPGFRHDVCSAVHPLLLASPAFRDIDLSAPRRPAADPAVAFAHPLGGTRAVSVGADVGDVARPLGADGPAYSRLFTPLVRNLDKILPAFLGSMRDVPPAPAGGRRGLRPARAPVGAAPGTPVPYRGGPGARRRHGRPFHAAADGAALRRLPPALHRAGAPLRLARGGGRQRRHRRRPRRRAHRRGRAGRDGPPGEGAGRAPPGTGRRVGRHPAPAGDHGGRCPSPARPAGALALPLRPRGVQGRLGPAGAGALARRELPAGRDPARGGHFRGDRPERGRRQRGPASRAPVLPRHPTLRGRPGACSRGRTHTVGLLPRAQRLVGGHDGQDRGADRAVRAGVPRPRPRPVHLHRGGHGGTQPELRRWRHQCRCRHTQADGLPPDRAVEPVPHRAARASTCARPPLRRGVACTACAVSARHGPRCTTSDRHRP